jgi:RES domain-containing protein
MTVYRICNLSYKDDLSGNGAKQYGARWNSPGIPMLYLASSISLAWLEILVHLQPQDKTTEFALLHIAVPEGATQLQLGRLKPNWQQDVGYTQFIGDEFVRSGQHLLLQVPSAVVPEESNCLINPLHPDWQGVKILSTKIFRFDERLFIKT